MNTVVVVIVMLLGLTWLWRWAKRTDREGSDRLNAALGPMAEEHGWIRNPPLPARELPCYRALRDASGQVKVYPLLTSSHPGRRAWMFGYGYRSINDAYTGAALHVLALEDEDLPEVLVVRGPVLDVNIRWSRTLRKIDGLPATFRGWSFYAGKSSSRAELDRVVQRLARAIDELRSVKRIELRGAYLTCVGGPAERADVFESLRNDAEKLAARFA